MSKSKVCRWRQTGVASSSASASRCATLCCCLNRCHSLPYLAMQILQCSKRLQFGILMTNKVEPQSADLFTIAGVCSCRCTICQCVPVCRPCLHHTITIMLITVSRNMANHKKGKAIVGAYWHGSPRDHNNLSQTEYPAPCPASARLQLLCTHCLSSRPLGIHASVPRSWLQSWPPILLCH